MAATRDTMAGVTVKGAGLLMVRRFDLRALNVPVPFRPHLAKARWHWQRIGTVS